jgi:hypothetical protein
MSNRLTKRSRSNYVAAVPAVAPRPAYCVTTTGDAIKYVKVTSLKNVGIQAAPGYAIIIEYHLDAKGNKITDDVLVPTLVHNVPVTACYAAQAGNAGREAASNTDSQVGWNSGARSNDTLSGDFDLNITFPEVPSGAVICGLAPDSATIGDFTAIEHGLYSAGSEIRFYELGVERFAFSNTSQEQPAATIRRIGGVVSAIVAGESYRSGTRSTGVKSITAALYAAGDYVDNPVVSQVFAGASSAPLSLGNEAPASRESLLMLGFAAGRDAGVGVPPVIGLDGVVTVFDLAMASIDRGLAHDLGVTAADVSPGFNISEEFVSGVRFVIDDPEVTAYDTTEFLEVLITEGLIPQSDVDFSPIVFATISESLTVGSVIDLFIGIDAKLFEALALPTNASATMVIETILRSGLSLSDYSSRARNEALQYATNIATGAVTRYSGFGFSSFCRVGTDLWATRADGLYKIGGETDNGELLSYLIDFAADDQGTARTKRLENIFLGISTDGRVYARLKDDFGREQSYRLIQRDSSEARIEPAKGASSRYWQLRLEGEGASYAEIDNIEWVAATGARRTKR